jgi:hypothetical protein
MPSPVLKNREAPGGKVTPNAGALQLSAAMIAPPSTAMWSQI